MYLDGYHETEPTSPPSVRDPSSQSSERDPCSTSTSDTCENHQPRELIDHTYASRETSARCVPCAPACDDCKSRIDDLLSKNAALMMENEKLMKQQLMQSVNLERKNGFTFEDLKKRPELVKTYTGLPSVEVFEWLFNQVKDEMKDLHYYRGPMTTFTPMWQVNQTAKPGGKRKLDIKEELLLVLMKLKLNLLDSDLAFRFDITDTTVSRIISTRLPFLAKKLKPLVIWPNNEELNRHMPKCFERHGRVKAIIDCTEVQAQRPSRTETNSETFSDYKQRHTKC
jgi:hypothetical protein